MGDVFTGIGQGLGLIDDPEDIAKDMAKYNLAQWYKTAFPQPGAIKSTKKAFRNQLAQGKTGAYGNMFNQMATRGFGSGSGLTQLGAQGIERDYLRNLGQGILNINKWGKTPMWGPQGTTLSTNPQMYPSAWSNILGGMGDLMETAMGFFGMQQMLGGMGGGGAGGYNPQWANAPWYQNFRQSEWGS